MCSHSQTSGHKGINVKHRIVVNLHSPTENHWEGTIPKDGFLTIYGENKGRTYYYLNGYFLGMVAGEYRAGDNFSFPVNKGDVFTAWGGGMA